MADRLRDATSPYLLQHAGNPVDWWPWCDEAFAAAREREVPVLLSVGYSACHWCHVMAHETFEDPAIAALMNEHLVSIKVDREERPDVDAVYMTATQAMTGQGGWPMTVFMTPGREPFYCGTYFPPDQFSQLVLGVARAWRQDRGAVLQRAERIAAALAGQKLGGWEPGPDGAPGPDGTADTDSAADNDAAGIDSAGIRKAAGAAALAATCEDAVTALGPAYDAGRGGFGSAPKFPPSMVLEFLLRHHERERGQSGAMALRMAEGTLRAMAAGGMYDQLGGGFARYSVDAGWVVPHFEKMLYDNALLARVYAHWWRRTGTDLGRRAAEQTCEWMIAGLRTPEGGFASALDADSEGEEGRYYVWTPGQLAEVLSPDDAQYAAAEFGVTAEGTFEHGASVLQLRADPQDPARLARVRAGLLAARQQRVPPARDDKVVAAWNGLAIAALAEAGLLFRRPDFTAAAAGAAELIARTHLAGGWLARTSKDGVTGSSAGVLDDYACVADGYLVLSGVTGQDRWVTLAGELLATALDRFSGQHGGADSAPAAPGSAVSGETAFPGDTVFYDTADDGEQLIFRPADPADGPSPSGTFALAGALLSYSALTGSARHRAAAAAALRPVTAIAARYPRAAGWGLAVAEAMLSGPAEIAVVGPPGDHRTAELHAAALHDAPPGAVLALGTGAPGGPDASGIPLLAGRTLINGAPAAYVCRDFACRLPVTTPGKLRAELAG